MDREIDDEIAGHLAEARDEFIQRGLSPDDAHPAALRSFGGFTQTKEVYRHVDGAAALSLKLTVWGNRRASPRADMALGRPKCI